MTLCLCEVTETEYTMWADSSVVNYNRNTNVKVSLNNWPKAYCSEDIVVAGAGSKHLIDRFNRSIEQYPLCDFESDDTHDIRIQTYLDNRMNKCSVSCISPKANQRFHFLIMTKNQCYKYSYIDGLEVINEFSSIGLFDEIPHTCRQLGLTPHEILSFAACNYFTVGAPFIKITMNRETKKITKEMLDLCNYPTVK